MDWFDLEWPDSLKKSLNKLWDMYETSDILNVLKTEEIVKFVEAEKQRTKDCCDPVDVKVYKENYQKIMNESEKKGTLEAQEKMVLIKKENMELKKEVELLKHNKVPLVEVIKNWRQGETNGVDVVQQEMKRLECDIAELLEARMVNISKIKRIKEICDE